MKMYRVEVYAALGAVICMAALIGAPRAAVAQQPRPAAQAISLDEVLAQTAEQNEEWQITEARIDQARAARRQALAALLPVVSVQASGTRNGEEVSFGGQAVRPQYDWGASGRASIAIFDGTMYPLLSRAGELLDAQKALAKWRRRSLLFEATQSFYVLAAAQDGVAIAERTVELRQKQLERAQALLDAKIAIKLDVQLAKTQLLEAKQALLEAKAARGNADDALGAILAMQPGVELRAQVPDAADATLAEPPERARLEVLDQRADFMATRDEIDAVELQETAAWASLLPLIDLSADAQLGPDSFSNPDGFTWALTVSATWLLYDGGARYAQIDQIQAQVEEQKLQYQRELRQAGVGLRQALRDWQTAVAAVEVARQQVESARQTYASARERFEHGLNTSVDVADASERLFQAESSLNRRVFQARTAKAQYRYLLGLVGGDE